MQAINSRQGEGVLLPLLSRGLGKLVVLERGIEIEAYLCLGFVD
jgi:hypothetical protein